mmetsp:Transcript_9434/g.28488  ORF Transcript_9434/g.28488 Transcript_9434/m.28488 type:complete len:350 (+) Transcript_9434:53-1102(+)
MKEKMRIASLLPSCTEIVVALGLTDHLVGVTHECEFAELGAGGSPHPARLTRTSLPPEAFDSQKAIDAAVKQSVFTNISLYTVDEEKLLKADPSVILTQALCDVCAPAYDYVRSLCGRLFKLPNTGDKQGSSVQIISLEPTSLVAVAETFTTVAGVCEVPQRGLDLKESFFGRLAQVEAAASKLSASSEARPSILLLEWLDPPFDGGHWIPDMVLRAGCRSPPGFGGSDRKSKEKTWSEISEADPDVIVIACCGFGLERNTQDTYKLLVDSGSAAAKCFKSLRACREGRVFAADADHYFARPSPSLAMGTAILARCAFDFSTEKARALEAALQDGLPGEGVGWQRIDCR